MAAGCREGGEQTVAVLALAVRELPGTDSTITFGGSQLLQGLQPGPVLPVQGLPLACRVIAGLPGPVTGIVFGLPGARQLSVGSLNQRRSLRTGLVAFRPCHLSDPGGFRSLLPGPDPGGLSISAGTRNRPGQLPPRLVSRLARVTGPGLGRLPAPVRGGRLLQRGTHLLLCLRGLRLSGDSTRLSAAPGRFRLGQLHGHHLRIQRRSLLPGHLKQRPGLRDQRRQRAERITSLLRRHRNAAGGGPGGVVETPRAHVTAKQASPAAASHRNQVPAAGPLAHTLAGVPGQTRHGQRRAGGHLSHGRFLSFLITISLQGNEEEENAPVNDGDHETPGHGPQARFPSPAGRGRRPHQRTRHMRQQPRRGPASERPPRDACPARQPEPRDNSAAPSRLRQGSKQPHGTGQPSRQRQAPPSPLPLLPGRVPIPQPRHHSPQMPQASTIQNQASARSRRPRAEHIGRVRRDKARHPVRQLHLQMRHPVHMPERIGPNPAPAQRMRQRRDHDLARQQGTETS